MTLKRGAVNPLNVLQQRKLEYIPVHFEVMRIANIQLVEKIDQWIYQNLNSRYSVVIKQGLDKNRKIVNMCEIGIEDPKELTMFGLACPLLKN